MENRKYVLAFTLFLLCLQFGNHIYAQSGDATIVGGKVYYVSASDTTRLANASVNITLLPSKRSVLSNTMGEFSTEIRQEDRSILFTKIGFKNIEYSISELLDMDMPLSVLMEQDVRTIEEVTVSSGYQKLKQGSITGSVNVVDQELFNRTAGETVLQRLENITPGLIFNRGDAQSTDEFLIRGRSTITAEARPLVVLDNFPFDGNLDDINPLDIESVSILKDAAAASIWGARAGNGVIVLTSKKGSADRINVNFQSSLAMQARPDLKNLQLISSADRLEAEKFLFEQGHYAGAFTGPYYNAVPYFVEKLAEGDVDIAQLQQQLSSIDVRDDLSRYF